VQRWVRGKEFQVEENGTGNGELETLHSPGLHVGQMAGQELALSLVSGMTKPPFDCESTSLQIMATDMFLAT
jgi:hypothetical protein